MKAFNRFGHWVRIADRWIFVRLVRLTSFLMRLFGLPILATLFRVATRLPLVRLLTVPLWRRVLLNAGFRTRAAEWLGWVVERWPTPKYQVLFALTLVEARQFVGIPSLLRAAKAALPCRARDGALYFDIVNIEAMLAVEKGIISPDAAFFAAGRGSAVTEFCYQRAWDAHAVLDGGGTRRFLNYYLRMVNYQPDLVFNVCDTLMEPNGLWEDMIAALEQAEARINSEREEAQGGSKSVKAALGGRDSAMEMVSRRKQVRDWRSGVHLRLVRAYLETGRFDRARELLAQEKGSSARKNHLDGLLLLHEPGQSNPEAGRRSLALAYADTKMSKAARSAIAGEIAVSYEESRDFEAARQYYVSSYYVGGVPYFLPEYLWRYVSFCMAQGDFGEAAHVMRTGLGIIWNGFRRVARVPIEKRLKNNCLIPSSGAFFLGCWGIGDDIIRIGMLTALIDVERTVKFGFSVDPRMQSLYKRSFPQFEFVSISRRNGPFGVGEEEYIRLRDGVPPSLDRGRLDINVLNAARRYPDIALTEDALVAFIQAGPSVCRPDTPLLKVMPEKVSAAREWLATLPPGLNIGISWRSGQRNVMRDKSYTDLVRDWGGVLSVGGVNFINLQYSWEEEELRQAEASHGCRIHMMPGVDLKNDIEDIVALAYVLDVVIAPGTAVREMCAAAGARVWSLSTTPVLPDLWRVQEDGERDRLFPSMIHITAHRYGDANGVLAEVAGRLANLTAPIVQQQAVA